MNLERRVRDSFERFAQDHPLDPSLIARTADRLPVRDGQSNGSRWKVALAGVTALVAASAIFAALSLREDDGSPASIPSEDIPEGTPALTASPTSPTESPTAAQASSTTTPTVSSAPLGDEEACANDEIGYGLTYPSSWFVHPRDAGRSIPDCALFGPVPFDTKDDSPGRGASVYVNDFQGNCLVFEFQPDRLEEVTVAQLPAYRIEVLPSESRPGSYAFVVNLEPERGDVLELPGQDASCTESHGLVIRTDEGASGDYELHKLVVDRMAAQLAVRQ